MADGNNLDSYSMVSERINSTLLGFPQILWTLIKICFDFISFCHCISFFGGYFHFTLPILALMTLYYFRAAPELLAAISALPTRNGYSSWTH